MTLAKMSGGDALLLRFWQWYAYGNGDHAHVQLSTREDESWSVWTTLGDARSLGPAGQWSLAHLDLTQYAGQTVRLGFLHTADADNSRGPGWYIDDLHLSHFVPVRLSLGVDVAGNFAMIGDRRYFAVDVPSGGHLRLSFDDADDAGITELYIRRGALPTAGQYDFRYPTAGADQTIFAPEAGAGLWYVLAIGDAAPPPGDFTIRADFFTGIGIDSITPGRTGNSVPATVEISGFGFSTETAVRLRQDDQTYLASDVAVVSPTLLLADFDLPAIPAGIYQLELTDNGSVAALPFEVLSGGTANLVTSLVAPSRVGRNTTSTIYVDYENTGDVAMAAPLLVLRGTDRAQMALQQTASLRIVPSFWTSADAPDFGDTVQFLGSGRTAGVLHPGESVRVPLTFIGLGRPWDFSDTRVDFTVEILDAASTLPIDWNAIESQVRPPSLPDDTWAGLWTNFRQQVGSTWGDYVAMLSDNARYLSRLGSAVTDVAELLNFEFAQANGLGVIPFLARSTDAVVPAPGGPLTFRRGFQPSLVDRSAIGDLGRGWSHEWEQSLDVAPDGRVTVHDPFGVERVFLPDSRTAGAYFAEPGDHGVLIRTGGAHSDSPNHRACSAPTGSTGNWATSRTSTATASRRGTTEVA
jgi:hypothetical protein